MFQGKVLPERAILDFEVRNIRVNFANGKSWAISVNVILNQISMHLEGDEADIFLLRNFALEFLSSYISILSFTHGHAYDVEITRVTTPDRSTDYVFGIETPCIAQLQKNLDSNLSFHALANLTMSEHGYFIQRFFTDFTLAMKHASDTGFYCFRGIEALRQHCAASKDLELTADNKAAQWDLFRKVSSSTREEITPITEAAKTVRHGGYEEITDEMRQTLLTATWAIAQKYFSNIISVPTSSSGT